MDRDDQERWLFPDIAPPALLEYTLEQYMESPGLVKQTNEWIHSVYQHLSEKDKQLRIVEQELNHSKGECSRLRKIEESLQERTKELQEVAKELMEKDKQLQMARQELNHLKEGSLRAS